MRGKRWWLEWLCLVLIVALPAGWWIAQQSRGKPFALSESAKTEPWPVQSGLKIAKLRDRIPTVNRLVLVPDQATFLFAIRQWNLEGRWPILIEDERYAPMFRDRFQPQEVIRLPAVNTALPTDEALRQAMQNAVASAWNARDKDSLKQQWETLGWEPPGVVITAATDPAWPAAVALASDRGQPLVFLPGNFGEVNDSISAPIWQGLKAEIKRGVRATGYPYSGLGDAVDTVTVVRELAVKYQSPTNERVDLAVTDGLGRHESGDRWAVVGWIYGSTERGLYQAMSAIFLTPETALLYDSYPPEEPWSEYEMNSAGSGLKKMGITATVVQRPEANLDRWRKFQNMGLNYDIIWVNSKGMKDGFAVGKGNASVEDIPPLKYPAMMHFLHSWSATTPGDRDTVGGRWLSSGAYLYVGSVHEPYLSAFIPPRIMLRRLQRTTPFLIAARQLESEPWKVTTIGDPLAIISPPRRRIPPSEVPLEGE